MRLSKLVKIRSADAALQGLLRIFIPLRWKRRVGDIAKFAVDMQLYVIVQCWSKSEDEKSGEADQSLDSELVTQSTATDDRLASLLGSDIAFLPAPPTTIRRFSRGGISLRRRCPNRKAFEGRPRHAQLTSYRSCFENHSRMLCSSHLPVPLRVKQIARHSTNRCVF